MDNYDKHKLLIRKYDVVFYCKVAFYSSIIVALFLLQPLTLKTFLTLMFILPIINVVGYFEGKQQCEIAMLTKKNKQ
jgi:hypothetical protein